MFKKGNNKNRTGIIFNTKVYKASVRNILNEMGADEIERIYIKRTPLSKVIQLALNVLSFGDFNKRLRDLPYDKLYHLRMDIETVKGKRYTLEKNETINMTRRPTTSKDTDSILVNTLKEGTTTNELLNKTKDFMGEDKFYSYSAKNNNCQDFIMGILNANNLTTRELKNFVKQDTTSLFTDTFRKITNTITDVGAAATTEL